MHILDRVPRKPRMQLGWMATVKEGDVLESASGLQRVVRRVSRYRNGDLSSLTFIIKKCSWTHRPYTILGYTDLRVLGYRPIGVSVGLGPFNEKLIAEMAVCNPGRMTCCDVKGMP